MPVLNQPMPARETQHSCVTHGNDSTRQDDGRGFAPRCCSQQYCVRLARCDARCTASRTASASHLLSFMFHVLDVQCTRPIASLCGPVTAAIGYILPRSLPTATKCSRKLVRIAIHDYIRGRGAGATHRPITRVRTAHPVPNGNRICKATPT
jgi:hypothetical protein